MKSIETALPRIFLLAGMAVLFPSLTWAAPVPGNPAVSSSASFTLLSAEPGAGGGRAASASGTITASLSFGDAVAGGVSNITGGGKQAKGGYTGQLYDGVSMALAAAPGTSVNEGDSVRLSALVTMDDGRRHHGRRCSSTLVDHQRADRLDQPHGTGLGREHRRRRRRDGAGCL
jgi:hypothetical protein